MSEEKLKREAEAARHIVEALAALEDDELTADMVEGETNFFECVDTVLEKIAEEEATARGAAAMAEQFTARSSAAKKRLSDLKAVIETAMLTAGLRETFRRPGGTVTLKKNPAALGEFEESEVPTQFFTPQKPKLDKKALLAAVKADELTGIPLKPESFSIQIRRA